MSEATDQAAGGQQPEPNASGAEQQGAEAGAAGADASASTQAMAPPSADPSAVGGAAEGSTSASTTPTDSASAATAATGASTNASPAEPSPEAVAPPESAGSKPASSTGKSQTGKSTTGQKSRSEKGISPGSPQAARSTTSNRRKRQKLGELDLATAKIGFLGAGKMAESTVNGLIHYAKINPHNIHVAAPSSKGLERFRTLGCRVTKRNYDIFGRYDCDIIFLCFHGYVIKHCYKLGGNRPHPLTTNYIPHQRHPIYILSLVSGVSLHQIKACLLNPDSSSRYQLEIHRIMMNTAVGHGLGVCAIDCEPDSKRLSPPLRQLLSSIAQLEHVPASQMDAACAIGGSGLAFSYYFINALADGAFKMGLSRQQAIRFASKTAQCAAQTMLESGKHPAELRDNVSSPSGAAIYGIHVLEKNDVNSGVTAAVEAAHKRAHDLATQDVQ